MIIFREYKMSDIGSRMEHLADLHELWQFALGIETAGKYQSEPSMERAARLEGAIQLLTAHMLNDYDPTTYAQVINNLPKPKDIPKE